VIDEGGYSLVALAEEDGLALISVILGANDYIFEDGSADIRSYSETLRLFQWGYTNFAWRDVLKTTELLARVPILHGSGTDFVNARPEESLSLLLNNAVPTNAIIRNITIFSEENDDPLVAPIEAGDILGEVVISRNGVIYARTNLVANTNVSLSGIEYIRGHVRELLSSAAARTVMLILGGLLIVYILLVVRYNIVRANRLRKIKEAKNDLIRERHQNFRE
jgi:D-alanyl-D-alanine carboxypeptidase (penicillin-binding protein 5/6)